MNKSAAHETATGTAWFRDIKVFVFLQSVITLLIVTDTISHLAVLTTLERRFGFKTVDNGIIIAAYDIGHVVLLIGLSFAGNKIHRPRLCAVGGILAIVSGILWATPHFLYGAGEKSTLVSSSNSSETALLLCAFPMNTSLGSRGCSQPQNVTSLEPATNAETVVSFWILFASQCCLGAALAPFLTVAITYVDDNTDPQTSALCVGKHHFQLYILKAVWEHIIGNSKHPTQFNCKNEALCLK